MELPFAVSNRYVAISRGGGTDHRARGKGPDNEAGAWKTGAEPEGLFDTRSIAERST